MDLVESYFLLPSLYDFITVSRKIHHSLGVDDVDVLEPYFLLLSLHGVQAVSRKIHHSLETLVWI